MCTCMHMQIKDEISRGRWAFEVKEEVGHVIVQPCVFVCAWVFMLVPDFSANECGRARRLPRTLLSDVTQTDACPLSQGSQASMGTYL